MALNLSSCLTRSWPPHLSHFLIFLKRPNQGISLPHFLHILLLVKRSIDSFLEILTKIIFTYFCHSYHFIASPRSLASPIFLGLPSITKPLSCFFLLTFSNVSIQSLEIIKLGTNSPLPITFESFFAVKSPVFFLILKASP